MGNRLVKYHTQYTHHDNIEVNLTWKQDLFLQKRVLPNDKEFDSVGESLCPIWHRSSQ